jgi:hypothetical protein
LTASSGMRRTLIHGLSLFAEHAALASPKCGRTPPGWMPRSSAARSIPWRSTHRAATAGAAQEVPHRNRQFPVESAPHLEMKPLLDKLPARLRRAGNRVELQRSLHGGRPVQPRAGPYRVRPRNRR